VITTESAPGLLIVKVEVAVFPAAIEANATFVLL
jgi:hypothetical protein